MWSNVVKIRQHVVWPFDSCVELFEINADPNIVILLYDRHNGTAPVRRLNHFSDDPCLLHFVKLCLDLCHDGEGNLMACCNTVWDGVFT